MKSEDIAKIVGVSRSTVSRVINNYPNVPEETRIKVLEAIEKHGYVPNTSARVLAGKQNDTIGLFITSNRKKKIYKHAYFSSLVNGIADEANESDYYLLVSTLYVDHDPKKIYSNFSQNRVAAGIYVGNSKDSECIKQICENDWILGIGDYDIEELKKYNIKDDKLVVINAAEFKAAVSVVDYLVSLGHKKIAILNGRLNSYSGSERYRGYKHAMEKHGLTIDPDYVLDCEFLKEIAREKVNQMLDKKIYPTAIFATNDDMAIETIQVLQEQGLRVPDDISVVGFDDIPASKHLTPALTTVRVPHYEIARQITEEIINRVKNQTTGLIYREVETELIIRDSCKSVR